MHYYRSSAQQNNQVSDFDIGFSRNISKISAGWKLARLLWEKIHQKFVDFLLVKILRNPEEQSSSERQFFVIGHILIAGHYVTNYVHNYISTKTVQILQILT